METRKPYPTDVSDEEWVFVAPYLTLLPLDAEQRKHDLREVFNALRFIVKTGMQWRMMPNDLPPWPAVYQQTQRWLKAGALEVVKLPAAKRGFVLLPRRWVVERDFAWTAHFRRLARDYERLQTTLIGFHFIAFVCLMLHQAAPLLKIGSKQAQNEGSSPIKTRRGGNL